MIKSAVIDEKVVLPSFEERDETNGGNAKSTVTLDIPRYIELLVRANVMDESLWPPSKRHGAKLLIRIREIERECAEKYGKWDWELISPELQDEYDGACGLLDMMQDTGERYSLEELLEKYGMEVE